MKLIYFFDQRSLKSNLNLDITKAKKYFFFNFISKITSIAFYNSTKYVLLKYFLSQLYPINVQIR